MRTCLALLALVALACAPPDPRPGRGEGPPAHRPADGLLSDTVLQRVVEQGLARDTEGLLLALHDPRPRVRARAAFALGSVQDPEALEGLIALLRDGHPGVRADAAFAVGQTEGEGLGSTLFDAFKVEWVPEVRQAQLHAMARRCDQTAARRLRSVEVVGIQGTLTRTLARCALDGFGGEEGWAFLAGRLSHEDPEIREWAAYPFGRSSEPEVWARELEAVRKALDAADPRDPAAMHLVRALGRAGDRESIPRLAWWLRRARLWPIRANAAEALGALDGPDRYAPLLEALADPSVHVRVQAAEALASSPPDQDVARAARARLQEHPEDTAPAGALLEILAGQGDAGTVEAWVRQVALGSGGDAAVIAGIRGARALEGIAGARLLQELTDGGSPRASRQAESALWARWGDAAGGPGVRGLFREVFEAWSRSPSPRRRRRGEEGLAELADPDRAVEGAVPAGVASEEEDPGTIPYRTVDWRALRRLGPSPRLHLETVRGRIELRLLPEEAPLTVDAIVATAVAGRYDDTPFHRVVPNFVAQGGDVSLGGVREGAGFHLRSEFTRVSYGRGVLGMASAGKDTETTQFFLTHSPQPHLDGGYTAFGWVEEGLDVLDSLAPEDRVLRAWVSPG